MRTRFIIAFISFLSVKGYSQMSQIEKANDFLKTVNSLNINKLRLGQYDTLINKAAEFTFTNDHIDPALQSKLFKARGDLRLELLLKKEKLAYTYSRDELADAEYCYTKASELDPSEKCNCLKQLKKLYTLDPDLIDNLEQKKQDIKIQIKKNC